MNHLEFAASESAALEPDEWDRWIDRVEKIIGHDLDGDQERDGYSLDFCGELFDAGKRPADAVQILERCKRALTGSGDTPPAA